MPSHLFSILVNWGRIPGGGILCRKGEASGYKSGDNIGEEGPGTGEACPGGSEGYWG